MGKKVEIERYGVLISFRDALDDEHMYCAGKDSYPRKGLVPTKARIAELQGSKNKLGKPIIVTRTDG
jgi:hypothetical protein